jgi:Fe-S-cluster containining protein
VSGVFFPFFKNINLDWQQFPEFTLKLYFKEVDSFNCSRCALCCSRPWGVGISADYYHRWEPVFQSDPDPRFHNAFERVVEGDLSANFGHLRKQADGLRCVFLDQDNLCLAQKKYGFEAKPLGCRKYPLLQSHFLPGLQMAHVMQSCRSAPAYILQEHELIYEFKPDNFSADDTLSRNVSVPVFSTLYFSRDTFLMWIGLQLDVLMYRAEHHSPVQNMRSFINLFQFFMSLRLPVYFSQQDMERLYLQHFEWLKGWTPNLPLRTVRLLERCLSLMPYSEHSVHMTAFYQGIVAGEFHWPTLSRQEYQVLNQFVRSYLARALLANYVWLTGYLNLFQYHVVLAATVCLLQFYLLAERQATGQSLSAEMIRDAINVIESQCLQSNMWLIHHRWAVLSEWECLQELELLLSLDLTVIPRSLSSFCT